MKTIISYLIVSSSILSIHWFVDNMGIWKFGRFQDVMIECGGRHFGIENLGRTRVVVGI